MRALARMDASAAVRSAREEAFASLLAGIRAELAALRGAASYPELFRSLLDESRAALPAARALRVDPRDFDLAMTLAGELRVDPALDTWGGLELAGDDGRAIRNTLEERLANAEPLLRRRFARRLARAVLAGVR
jgi:vacuolar-type H+-ATPase subunit E/Vma4